MRITTITDEASLDELVDRVHGAGASKQKGVREAFLKINPHLADFEKLPAGTPVVLPPSSAAPPAPDPRTENAIAQMQQTVALTRNDVDAGSERAAAVTRSTAELLNDPKFMAALRADSDAAERRVAVLQALGEEEKEWNEARASMSKALAGFEETLKNWRGPTAPEENKK